MNHISEVHIPSHEQLIHFHYHGDPGEHGIAMDQWFHLGADFQASRHVFLLSLLLLTFTSFRIQCLIFHWEVTCPGNGSRANCMFLTNLPKVTSEYRNDVKKVHLP